MKTKIISSSSIDTSTCISPRRYLEKCEDCHRVKYCKYPEGRNGNIKIKENQIEEMEKDLNRKKEELLKLKEELQ